MLLQTSLLLTTFLSSASAQYALNRTVGSCADVDCPDDDSQVGAECQVVDRTYGAIGLRSFSTAITDDNNNLTWTMATHTDTDDVPQAEWVKDFYLGTPPSLQLDSEDLPYQGCAVFLYRNPVDRNNSWDCEAVVGATCISLLVNQVNTLLAISPNGTETTQESCSRVQEGLSATFPTECSEMTNVTSWGEITAIPLTGSGAPTPPNSSTNASSNCHPTLPKSNDLSLAFGYNETGVSIGTDIIITSFWSPDKDVENALSVPDSHLMCLWINPITNRELANYVESAATHTSVGIVGLLICLGLGLFELF